MPADTAIPQVATSAASLPVTPRAWICWLIAGPILLGHAWLTLRLFPSVAALVDNQPAISVDHAIHIYHGYLGAKFLKEHGTSWGYDPFFMAGYPKTPVYDSSSGLAELFQFLAGGVYSPRAYKIGIAVLVCLVPVVVGLASGTLSGSPWAAAATITMCTWYWWIGFPAVLVRTGLVAFVWSSALAVLLPVLLVQWGRSPSRLGWLSLVIVAALGVESHAIFAIMVLVPTALGYACLSWRAPASGGSESLKRGLRWHLATWAAVVVVMVLTSFWWRPLLQFLPLKTASELFMTYQGDPGKSPARHVVDLAADYYLLSDGRVPGLLVLFGVVGLAKLWRGGSRLECAVLGAQLAALSALTFAGSEWRPTRNLEPLRFQVPLGLAWSVAAGHGIAAVLAGLGRLKTLRQGWLPLAGSLATFALAVLLTTPALWWRLTPFRPDHCPASSWELTSYQLRSARPLAVGLRPEMNQLVDWIRANTDNTARILFEDQLRLLEHGDPSAPESVHWTPLLPLLTGREFVGGLYHMAFIPHQRAAFGDWHLAGKHIRDWSDQDLRAFCEQYNIGWVITWSRASWMKQGEDRGRALSSDVFANLPFCELVARIGRHTVRPDENEYQVFRVRREFNFFKRGRGRVDRVGYNRIELGDLEPEDGELILRYHWLNEFGCDPAAASLEQAVEPGDPVGFVRIRTDRPIEHLIISNSYGRPAERPRIDRP